MGEPTPGATPAGPPGLVTVAVVLAAGAGSRFAAEDGTHKLLAPWRGRPVLAWSVDAAVESRIGPVVVVAGAVDAAAARLALDPIGEAWADQPAPEVSFVANHAWAEGQATSLAVALDAAERAGADAVVVGLGDQPGVGPGPWRAVAASAGPVAVATYDGQRANPVRLHRSVWGLLPRHGDIGARAVMQQRPELVVEVACRGMAADIDTVEDMQRWS